MIGNFQSNRSRRAVTLASVVAGTVMGLFGAIQAQEAREFREFTDKQGRALEASPVSVTPDRKNLKILLRDGKEVDLEIVLLSLDDQQYLRGWVTAQPSVSNYRLDVTVEKLAAKPSLRRRNDYYRMNTEYPAYRVRLTNLSRETLAAPVVEYYLLMEEGARIFQDPDDNGWDFITSSSGNGSNTLAVKQATTLPDMVYNRPHEVTTPPLEIDEVISDGSVQFGQDKLIGLIVQVREASGNVVGTWRSSDTGVGRMNWEDAVRIAELATQGTDPGGPGQSRRTRLSQGETIPAGTLDATGRTITVRAEISPDSLAPDGIIASHGGPLGGWALLVKNGEVIFAVRKGNRSPRRVSAPLPEGTAPVQISAVFAESGLGLVVNDSPEVTGDSPGLFEESPTEALSVGFESGDPVLPDYEAPFKFSGTITDFSVRLGARSAAAVQ